MCGYWSFSNPWLECHLTKMAHNHIPLIRRQSGGGTVYHDQHNVNFSFIADRKLHNQVQNHEIVVNALKDLGVNAIATKRGDILLDDGTNRKISGSAFKQKKDQAFHHGTMLINSDLTVLNEYIHSKHVFKEAKGIKSTRSKVANISEIQPEIDNQLFIKSLINQYKVKFKNVEIEKIDAGNISSLVEYERFLKSYEWKFLETPSFIVEETFTFQDRNQSILLEIKKGVILNVEMESDDEPAAFLNELQKTLKGKSLELYQIEKTFSQVEHLNPSYVKNLSEWFINYFELRSLNTL